MDAYSPYLLEAICYAAEQHKYQRRKGFAKIPYINHPLKVARLIYKFKPHVEESILLAAILHDTIEDTDTTAEILENKFGAEVAQLVLEVTDDKTLDEPSRKQKQIDKAPFLSDGAKIIKIADKICNMLDLLHYPIKWTDERKIRYMKWSKDVVIHCKGICPDLDKEFDHTLEKAKALLNTQIE